MRVSDDDRDRTVQRLQQAFAEGFLTAEEMDERLGLALTARSHGDLVPVVADLPADLPDEVELKSGSGRVRRAGQWRVPRLLRVISTYGGAKLDLSQAVIGYPVIEIELQLMYGSATIILPPGATANTDGLATEWGTVTCKVPGLERPGNLHVRVSGELTYGHLKVGNRRTWLRAHG